MKNIKTISFIGAGNVATQFAKAFAENGIHINQIYSRSMEHAELLANQVNAKAINEFTIVEEVDCIVVAVPDDIIPDVFEQLSQLESPIVHTSGISNLIDRNDKLTGYFYPLDTFRKETNKNLTNTPIFVGASNSELVQALVVLGKKISENVKIIAPENKQRLHLSAVFVNNYVNHLFGLTYEFLQQHHLSFSDLKPIVEHTITTALQENPLQFQTGPALRNDESTKERHLQLLANNEEMKQLYNAIWESIQRKHHVS